MMTRSRTRLTSSPPLMPAVEAAAAVEKPYFLRSMSAPATMPTTLPATGAEDTTVPARTASPRLTETTASVSADTPTTSSQAATSQVATTADDSSTSDHETDQCKVCRMFAEGLMSEDMEQIECVSGTCKLCEEQNVTLYPVQRRENYPEQWPREQVATQHMACAECLAGWVGAQLDDMKAFVPCPFGNCPERMHLDDVHAFSRPLAFCLQKSMERDFSQSFEALTVEESTALKELGIKHCPECFLAIERIEGCRFMICICGNTFCFDCGVSYTNYGNDCGCEPESIF